MYKVTTGISRIKVDSGSRLHSALVILKDLNEDYSLDVYVDPSQVPIDLFVQLLSDPEVAAFELGEDLSSCILAALESVDDMYLRSAVRLQSNFLDGIPDRDVKIDLCKLKAYIGSLKSTVLVFGG